MDIGYRRYQLRRSTGPGAHILFVEADCPDVTLPQASETLHRLGPADDRNHDEAALDEVDAECLGQTAGLCTDDEASLCAMAVVGEWPWPGSLDCLELCQGMSVVKEDSSQRNACGQGSVHPRPVGHAIAEPREERRWRRWKLLRRARCEGGFEQLLARQRQGPLFRQIVPDGARVLLEAARETGRQVRQLAQLGLESVQHLIEGRTH
jgi:hypothetical protein